MCVCEFVHMNEMTTAARLTLWTATAYKYIIIVIIIVIIVILKILFL